MTLRQEYEARKSNRPRPRHDLKDRIALIAVTVSIAGVLLTFLSFLVAKGALDLNRSALVASNRAWIAPLGIDLTGPIEATKNLPFNVYYSNVGKSPAIAVTKYEVIILRKTVPALQTSPVFAGPNLTCDNLQVPEVGEITFQDDKKDHWHSSFIEAKYITPEILSGESYLIVRGCIRYRTIGELHKTALCYVAVKGDLKSSRTHTEACGDGNFAD
jgi:hypothetical protein